MQTEDMVVGEADVVRRAQAGDQAAFLELYNAYLGRIYDFCLRMLRNSSDAEDATSDAFLKAMERLGDLKDPRAFKGWLYAIARNTTLSLTRTRGRAVPVAEHDERGTLTDAAPLGSPDIRAEEGELKELVWDAAATLNPRDYAVFELAVRHGLHSSEIADALEVRPAYAYILVNRLKSSVAEALEALLLVRTGRRDCAKLSALVANYGEEGTPRLRKAVSRHAKSCEVCTRTRKGRASVTALLQGTAFADPSSAFRDGLAQRLRDGWTTPASPPGVGLASLVASIVAVVVATMLLVGMAAQRTIQIDSVIHFEFDKAGQTAPPPTGQPDTPLVPPQDPPPEPDQDTVIVVTDPTPEETTEPTEEPTDPPRTDPPATRPPPTEPPTIR